MMSTHMIVLVLDVDPPDGDPADWDWGHVVDTPLPVSVVAHAELDADPDEGTVGRFTALAADFRAAVVDVAGVK